MMFQQKDNNAGTVWLSVRTLPGGALVVWQETLSQTPWLINKSAGGPPFNEHVNEHVDVITARKNGGAGRQVVISESENGVEVHFNKR